MLGRFALGLSILAVGGLLASGCGGDGNSTAGDTNGSSGTTGASGTGGGTESDAAAIAVFNSSGCAGCHVFSVADASGPVGPNLDATALSKDEIEARIRSGGGAMPPYEGELSDAQINSLAELISTSS